MNISDLFFFRSWTFRQEQRPVVFIRPMTSSSQTHPSLSRAVVWLDELHFERKHLFSIALRVAQFRSCRMTWRDISPCHPCTTTTILSVFFAHSGAVEISIGSVILLSNPVSISTFSTKHSVIKLSRSVGTALKLTLKTLAMDLKQWSSSLLQKCSGETYNVCKDRSYRPATKRVVNTPNSCHSVQLNNSLRRLRIKFYQEKTAKTQQWSLTSHNTMRCIKKYLERPYSLVRICDALFLGTGDPWVHVLLPWRHWRKRVATQNQYKRIADA